MIDVQKHFVKMPKEHYPEDHMYNLYNQIDTLQEGLEYCLIKIGKLSRKLHNNKGKKVIKCNVCKFSSSESSETESDSSNDYLYKSYS